LRGLGFDVVSADELDRLHPPEKKTWGAYLRRDIPYLLECDTLVTIPGWRGSKGASLESAIAAQFALPAFELLSDDGLRAIPTNHMPRIVHPV
jgi:hypothetical protein